MFVIIQRTDPETLFMYLKHSLQSRRQTLQHSLVTVNCAISKEDEKVLVTDLSKIFTYLATKMRSA